MAKGPGVKRKLCIVPSDSCYIYVTWKSKEVGRGRLQSHHMGGGTNFYGMELTPPDIRFTIFRMVMVLLLVDDVNHYMHLSAQHVPILNSFKLFFSRSLKNLEVILKVLSKMLVNYFATFRQ